MFEGQPKGLYALALANTGERFGYYTMLAIFVLFLQANFGFSEGVAGQIYGGFLAFVYFLPLLGGAMADKFGFGKMVTTGIAVMFIGYILLALPLGKSSIALVAMFGALVLISFGTGLFKGNLQVLVGNLYDVDGYQDKRDAGFSIFYMAINIGALFAPSAAVAMMNYAQNQLGATVEDSYHYAFGIACLSLIVSMAIYFGFRFTFSHVLENKKGSAATGAAPIEELSKQETKDRIVALCLVFAVVIFFWMAFHQNGLTLTLFAKQFTAKSSAGIPSMAFDVWNLVLLIIIVYASFAAFQNTTSKGKGIAVLVLLAAIGGLIYKYNVLPAATAVEAPIFQQFNPCFVVALTPVSMALFGWLARTGKEPSAPRKIALGMLVAAIGFVVMAIGSFGLPTPTEQKAAIEAGTATFPVSPYWLISTYLVLTFGELLLSPMGISFVSKVAPPKYKGMMMGGWFAATAVGNYLTSIPALLWGNMPLVVVWGILIALCVVAAAFMFAIMKRLEKVC